MTSLTIVLDGDNAWPDLKGRRIIEPKPDSIIQLAVLEQGMASGQPSISIRIDLPHGDVLIAQTSARLFCSAARIVMSRYPDLFEAMGGRS